MVGLTRSAVLDYGAHGMRINAVVPAFIHTRTAQSQRRRRAECTWYAG
jgi:NAD(P)-dependent dehydrogenase (short-subunit alcohol dehydrogenase family)